MSLELINWDIVAGNNNSAPPDGAPESTTKLGHINNIIREMMAVLARFDKDTLDSIIVSTGTGSAFTVQLNRGITSYYEGLTFRWRNHTPNAVGAVLSVNGLAYKQIVDASGEPIAENMLNSRFIETTYAAFYDKWVVTNFTSEKTVPFNVPMPMFIASAPIRWQQVAWHDALIRIVGNQTEGAQSGGNWAISGLSTESTAHNHTFSGQTGHPGAGQNLNPGSGLSGAKDAHSHMFAGTTSFQSVLHTHSGDGTWRPFYVNAIACYRVQ